ncbi:MAG: aminotransferase class III-fold pyridoxal phosphate-dependent enzyme [bacterium]
MNIGTAEYFQQVRELCNETGALLIIDEIQSGFCRTGKMFACDHFHLEPDILCFTKAMAGDLPITCILYFSVWHIDKKVQNKIVHPWCKDFLN